MISFFSDFLNRVDVTLKIFLNAILFKYDLCEVIHADPRLMAQLYFHHCMQVGNHHLGQDNILLPQKVSSFSFPFSGFNVSLKYPNKLQGWEYIIFF